MTAADDQTLRELAGLAGIHLGFRNAFGHNVDTPMTAIAGLLAVLGFDTDTPEAIEASRRRLLARWERPVPRLIVAEADRPREVALRTDAHSARWRITDETGAPAGEGEASDGEAFFRLMLPPLPAGYFTLEVTLGAQSHRGTIISAPPRCWRPTPPRRIWGLSGPAYGVSSEHDLGIGDFSDIRRIVEAAGARGASFLTISPLHALFTADREMVSPYSPSSRLFLDPIYIDPAAIAGLETEAAAIIAALAREDVIAAARSGPLIDYQAAWKIKRYVLAELWPIFKARGENGDFAAFRERRGKRLEDHARFEARANRRDGKEPDADEIAFHAWLQWIADAQFADAEAAAEPSGMALGLFADLAVGATSFGSELLSAPDEYLTGASIGAPPDELAPGGQDWGLRALSPLAMEETGLAAFRALIAANMRHVSGLRIDHAFQLSRLYLIPVGRPASEGAYLTYPSEAMFAVLRIESHRARCMVIGEDLGTQPPHFSELLDRNGCYGYRVLYFERFGDGAFKPPGVYDERVQAVIATHDLATFAGWWLGNDIDERLAVGTITADDAERERAGREADRHRLAGLLASEGLLPDPAPPTEAPFAAVARLLGRCRSELVSFQLDDLAGARHQQNVPGVVSGVANWRRRLPMTIEALAVEGGPLDMFSQAMTAEGRHPPLHHTNRIGEDG